MQVQRVAGRVEEDRLLADAAVEDLADELHPLRGEVLVRGLDVVDVEGKGNGVRAELLAEGGRLHDGERDVAGLELRRGHVAPPLDGRQPEDGSVEVCRLLEVLGGDAQEIDAGDERRRSGGHAAAPCSWWRRIMTAETTPDRRSHRCLARSRTGTSRAQLSGARSVLAACPGAPPTPPLS